MNVRDFKPEDLSAIELQEHQKDWRLYEKQAEYAGLLAQHLAITIEHEGMIMACAGVMGLERDVGITWSFISKNAGPHLFALRRIALRMFESAGKRRILANCHHTFAPGARWLELLGFEKVESLEALAGSGDGQSVYLRVA